MNEPHELMHLSVDPHPKTEVKSTIQRKSALFTYWGDSGRTSGQSPRVAPLPGGPEGGRKVWVARVAQLKSTGEGIGPASLGPGSDGEEDGHRVILTAQGIVPNPETDGGNLKARQPGRDREACVKGSVGARQRPQERDRSGHQPQCLGRDP